MIINIFKKVGLFTVYIFNKGEADRKRKTVVFFLLGTFVLMFAVYFLLIVQTVFNVVGHQDLESMIPKYNAELQQKKFEYITLSNELDRDEAESMGLVVLQEGSVEYITRDPIGLRD